MNIMTKRGSLDNVVTYEHICDTTADMDNINPNYITLGSTCIVLSGDDSDEMEVYIANSKKEWKPIATGMIGGGSNSGSGGTSGIMRIVAANSENGSNAIVLDKTWQEIYDFISGGGFAYIQTQTPNGYGCTSITIISFSEDEGVYAIVTDRYLSEDTGYITFFANSEDDYPIYMIQDADEPITDDPSPVHAPDDGK